MFIVYMYMYFIVLHLHLYFVQCNLDFFPSPNEISSTFQIKEDQRSMIKYGPSPDTNKIISETVVFINIISRTVYYPISLTEYISVSYFKQLNISMTALSFSWWWSNTF